MLEGPGREFYFLFFFILDVKGVNVTVVSGKEVNVTKVVNVTDVVSVTVVNVAEVVNATEVVNVTEIINDSCQSSNSRQLQLSMLQKSSM